MNRDCICPNCASTLISLFYKLPQQPVHSVVLMYSKKEALAVECADINLGFCDECGFIGNFLFQQNLLNYASECETTQVYSPTFSTFQEQSAKHFINTYDLHDKDIIEIGCGHGEFLKLLCRLGNNRGLGFDPAYQRDLGDEGKNGNVRFIRDYYSEKYADIPADFIVSKMTLEHIFETRAFIRQLKHSLGGKAGATIFVQVPDATRILTEAAFWDIHYEHCCYFTPTSLSAVFQDAGFDIIDVRNAYFDTYLIIEAKLSTTPKDHSINQKAHLPEVRAQLEHFKSNIERKVTGWREKIRKLHKAGQRMVIWGSSSKATAFLTTLGIMEEIEYVVDINPYRQETFMPGTGQKIIAPEFLKDYQPDHILVINPIYCEEIQGMLDNLGVKSRIITPQEV